MEAIGWEFPTLAYVWDYRNGAILAGGDRLDALSEAERERSVAALTERVRMMTGELDDGWLVMTAFFMVDDIYKSFFRAFGWTPGVEDYLAATAGVVVQELDRRGFVLHYVVDATQPEDNLAMMLDFLRPVFIAAGLAVVGPQMVAFEIFKREEGEAPSDISAIQRFRDDGHAIADEVVSEWHQDRRSSAYFNIDLDDGLPGLALDVALSQRGTPGTIVVFRNQPPAEGSRAELSPPPEVTLPMDPSAGLES